MARIGVKGLIVADVRSVSDVHSGTVVEVPSIPVLDALFAQIHNAINGQLDSTNLASSAVGTTQLADASVTAAKIVAGTITPAQTADTVGQTYSATYTGDGTTADRVIAIPFTPRWVQVIPTTGALTEYMSHGQTGTAYSWYRDNTGAVGNSTANWQGIVASGVKLGTSATGTSNTAAVVYSLVAWK